MKVTGNKVTIYVKYKISVYVLYYLLTVSEARNGTEVNSSLKMCVVQISFRVKNVTNDCVYVRVCVFGARERVFYIPYKCILIHLVLF